MATVMIKNIADLAKAAKHAVRTFNNFVPWWRGQADSSWKLIPGIFRDKNGAGDEQLLATEFMRQAPVLYQNCPSAGAWADWLYLMQHYRLRTRLLDWTESALVGVFFATTEPLENNAALWALHPGKMNESQGMSKVVPHYLGNSQHKLFEEAIFGSRSESNSEKKIMAVVPNSIDLRMQAQSGVFTIHGSEISLDELQGAGQFLLKYEIPFDAKAELRHELELLGIKQSYLFPDLENLAKYLNRRGSIL